MVLTLAAPAHSELLIKKSRFIGCVQSVESREQAQAVVDALWKEHPDARHICWALLAGGHSAAVDDGEPGGTAGRPMLEVLRHHDLDGVLATVVRYFGGIKLGAGGLVRAYTDAVAQAVAIAEKVERIEKVTIICEMDYALEGRVRYVLEQQGIELLGVEHEAGVVMRFRVPVSEQEALQTQLRDMSQGTIIWRVEKSCE
ncbi:MAG: IMPACT family protein [Saezia sp.]